MRVIAGKAKGCPLIAPKGTDTRPIPAKIKEALFSIWQMRIADARFLDLFAGSGSVGIEAVSRGAQRAVFVERDRRAVNVIKRNLAACRLSTGYEVYQGDVFRQIRRLKERGDRFDIIYLDPPFTVDELFIPVLEVLSESELLASGGEIAIRTRAEKEMPDFIGALQKYKQKIYGISSLHFYHIPARME